MLLDPVVKVHLVCGREGPAKGERPVCLVSCLNIGHGAAEEAAMDAWGAASTPSAVTMRTKSIRVTAMLQSEGCLVRDFPSGWRSVGL